jgi:hypothetical protein
MTHEPIVIWEPQPGPQMHLVTCPYFECFFGGARGGGKTDGVLGEWLGHADKYGQYATGLMFRRERTQLMETIERSKQIYTPLGAAYSDTEKQWRMPNGARLKFAYLENDGDADAYQGHSYTRLYPEELGTFPNPAPIMKLKATLRSAMGVPVGFRATGNPGGPGHTWVRARYIDPAPNGYKVILDPNGLERVFIPSKVSDNPKLIKSDPGYIARLKASGSPELVRAWLEGDWDIVAGAFFPEWSVARHVVRPRTLPNEWTRAACMDWGSARPFAVLWFAISDGSLPEFPRGALVFYREWYGIYINNEGAYEPNTGIRLPAELVGRGIREREQGERITYRVLDPAAFSSDGGPSIAERLYNGGSRKVAFRRADNKRIAKAGAMGGWDQVRARLVGEDGRPMMYVFDTCVHLIRTLPALQHDPTRPEDVNCWVAGTLISTPTGPVPIEDVMPGDIVDTPVGPRPVLRSYLSGATDTVWLRLADGRYLEGTTRHKVYVSGKGLVALENIECHDVLREKNKWQRLLNIAVSSIAAIRAASTTIQTAPSCSKVARACIGKYGSMLAMSFRRAGISITRTVTTTIMPWRISSACRPANMPGIITLSAVTFDRSSRFGSALTLVLPRSGIMPARCERAHLNGNARALIVDLLLRLDTLGNATVPERAAKWRTILLNWFARFAGGSSTPSTTRRNKFEPARIIAAGRCVARMPVYNLTVADAHLFYANGILSANSDGEDHAPDATRYGCMSRPWIAAEEPKNKSSTFVVEPPTLDELWREHSRHGRGWEGRI